MPTRGNLFLAIAALFLLAGCAAPVAELQLVAQAREALRMAADRENDLHRILVNNLSDRVRALDAMFEEDVRRASHGEIVRGDGTVAALTADWVIEGLRGYSIMRRGVEEQGRLAEQNHAAALDNIRAGLQCLDMVTTLVTMQQNVAENLKPWLIELQRSSSGAAPTARKE